MGAGARAPPRSDSARVAPGHDLTVDRLTDGDQSPGDVELVHECACTRTLVSRVDADDDEVGRLLDRLGCETRFAAGVRYSLFVDPPTTPRP